jgi:hypothetical protein
MKDWKWATPKKRNKRPRMDSCKHEWRIHRGDAYVYESCEPNDTVNVTLTCVHCRYVKTATIGVNDDGAWE